MGRDGEGRDKIERRGGLERDRKGWRGTGQLSLGQRGTGRYEEGRDGVEMDVTERRGTGRG